MDSFKEHVEGTPCSRYKLYHCPGDETVVQFHCILSLEKLGKGYMRFLYHFP